MGETEHATSTPGPDLYERIVEAAPTAMVMVDDAGRIVLVNLAAEQLFGYGRDELLGHPVEEVVPELARAGHPADRTARLAKGGAPGMGAGRDPHARRKDGTLIPVEIGLNQVVTEHGSFVLGVVADISERERAEDRFRLAVEAAPNAMLMVDAAGRIVLVNTQAEKLFGHARDELIGRSVEMLVPERFRGEHPAARAHFAVHPETRPMGAGRELSCLRKDGTEVPVEIGLNPLATPQGTFVLSSVIDITERKRAESERERLLERERSALAAAEAANRAKDEFLSVLSHELRTPLNSILGWATILLSGARPPDETVRGLETIARNARLQARIVADVLDVSRIIQGRFALEVKPCDPAAVVESALASIRPAAKAKRLTIRSSLDPVGEILADAGRLEQVLWNLLSNAVKFTPRGGSVDVELRDLTSHVDLRVRDSGEGIPSEFLPRIFDRFTQADASSTRQHGGLGLGLAIARHLVEMHGGTIVADSGGSGQGTTIRVMLPVSPADDAVRASVSVPAPPSPTDPVPVLDRLRIVVVDDEPDTRELLHTSLAAFGATVAAAGSVPEAVALVREFHPDIVVSDIAMPGEDGFCLLRRVRETEPATGYRIPVVALTAYAGSEERRAVLDSGFETHVAKPVEPARLAAVIAQVVRSGVLSS